MTSCELACYNLLAVIMSKVNSLIAISGQPLGNLKSQAVVRQLSGSRQAVIKRPSRIVLRQSSGSRQAVVRQSSGSRQAVVRQSSGSRQTVFWQLLGSRQEIAAFETNL